MQITRAKATALLNKGEMQLYDDSRQNPIRGFTVSQLESRITRARAARDRSRDLVRRQKLGSRARTGSKRGASGGDNQRSKDKAEILADVLKRFEAQVKVARKEEKAAKTVKKATKKAAKKTAKKAAKKAAGKKAPARAVKKTAKKAPAKAAKKAARKKTAGKTAAKKTARVTRKQALRSTRKLLKAKQEQARQAPAWQGAGAHAGQVDSEGFQTGAAARRAEELRAAESRQPAIHGSIGTRGRINQGKRDSKGGGGG